MRYRGPNRSTSTELSLLQQRERRGISLEKVMEQTKLSRRFLEAIEDGAYEELPGGIFTISYLRQYAAATGLEVEPLLEHFRLSTGAPAQAKPPAQEGMGRTGARQALLRLFLG